MCFGRKKKKAKEEEAKRLAAQQEAERKAAEEKKEAERKEAEKKAAVAKKEETKKEPKTAPKAKKEAEEETTTEEVDVKTRKAVYRVLFDKEDKLWKIKKDGAKRVIDSRKTKEEALARVQELSQSQDSNFVVYKKDGKFQKKANLNLKNTDKEDK